MTPTEASARKSFGGRWTLSPISHDTRDASSLRTKKYPLALPRGFDDPTDSDVVYLREEDEGPTFAVITHTEEKATDVNLASKLLADAFRAKMRVAAVVSNDADLVEPIRMVTQQLDIPVGIINPRKFFQPDLAAVASFKRNIETRIVKRCQFPDILEDDGGEFGKPRTW